jgi:hypothetical protein
MGYRTLCNGNWLRKTNHYALYGNIHAYPVVTGFPLGIV